MLFLPTLQAILAFHFVKSSLSKQIPSASSSAPSCGLYFAESTIPNAGFGMFAGDRAYEIGDKLASGDSLVPVYEMDWHNGHQTIHFLWDEYTWHSSVIEGINEDIDDADSVVSIASTGFGAMPNSWMPLVNIEDSIGVVVRASSAGVSSQAPTAGSFTPFHGRQFEALTRIEAGMELYLGYGKEYFESRTNKYGYIPFADHYKEADRMLQTYDSLSQQSTSEKNASYASTLRQDLYDALLHTSQSWETSRILNALPSNLSAVEHVMTHGGTSMQHYNTSIRSIEWLKENGKCMDNIRDGISEISNVGRGAFAVRSIAKDHVVAPAPLIHIPEKDVLRMYGVRTLDMVHVRNTSNPVHWQLILNYCFGHPDSTLLLCPYGLLTFQINHSSKRPNVKIVWDSSMRQKDWLDAPLYEWARTHHNGLAFDYVALRDIGEGEEILLDYGQEWEDAWDEHARNWKPPRLNYTPAYELNEMADLQLQTWYERPYESDSVHLTCRLHFLEPYNPASEHSKSPCRILFRHDDGTYTAELLRGWVDVDNTKKEDTDDRYTCRLESKGKLLWRVPRDAFLFKDIRYERDHHQPWSFRHEMMIPDDMFPDVWKNRLVTGPPDSEP